jgi:hypothetical protein
MNQSYDFASPPHTRAVPDSTIRQSPTKNVARICARPAEQNPPASFFPFFLGVPSLPAASQCAATPGLTFAFLQNQIKTAATTNPTPITRNASLNAMMKDSRCTIPLIAP